MKFTLFALLMIFGLDTFASVKEIPVCDEHRENMPCKLPAAKIQAQLFDMMINNVKGMKLLRDNADISLGAFDDSSDPVTIIADEKFVSRNGQEVPVSIMKYKVTVTKCDSHFCDGVYLWEVQERTEMYYSHGNETVYTNKLTKIADGD